jgi:hypothetical protein
MTVHVRWPAKNSGAFVFGLNFWFFWFKPKEQIKKSISLSEDLETTFLFFVLKQRKETKENSRTNEWLRPFVRANAHEESL